MLTTTILIAGGLVIGGTRILLKRKQSRTPVWLTQSDGSRVKSYAMVVERDELAEINEERMLNTNYALSTVSLGLSIAGALVFAPFDLIGLPLDIYSFGVIIEEGYDGLAGQRRIAQFAAFGIAITTVVLSNQFLVVSFIEWGYFFYRRTAFEVQRRLAYLRPAPAAEPAVAY